MYLLFGLRKFLRKKNDNDDTGFRRGEKIHKLKLMLMEKIQEYEWTQKKEKKERNRDKTNG